MLRMYVPQDLLHQVTEGLHTPRVHSVCSPRTPWDASEKASRGGYQGSLRQENYFELHPSRDTYGCYGVFSFHLPVTRSSYTSFYR